MKKIININLSGRLIPIEDSAYEILKAYIESLRRHFAHEEGRDEIISDIESRIAELFQEKIKKGAHCITDADVETVIASIGRPEDFDDNEETTARQATASGYAPDVEDDSNAVPRSRLSRNANDKIIAGVCSGIAHSLRIDPSLVRILFALIAIGGFGTGLLIYIVLWVILPSQQLEPNIQKRLFRNPEQRVLGGVAGGIAAYFNVEVWVPRLVFAAPLIVNILLGALSDSHFLSVFVGSLTGTFFLAYIILWIVVPVASTTSERLQMKGQKVDLTNIKNTVKEELQYVKEKAGKVGAEIKENAISAGQTGKAFAAEMTQTARPVASGLGHAIGVLFKAFFLCIAGLIAFALFAALIGLFGVGLGTIPFKGYILQGATQNLLAWGTLILFLGVPIVGFIVWLIRKIIGAKSHNSFLGYTFGALWLIGLFCAITLTVQVANGFSTRARISEDVSMAQPNNGRLIVKVADSKVKIYGGWFKSDWLNVTNDSLIVKSVQLKIIKSNDSLYHMSSVKYSRGRDGREAQHLAGSIRYGVAQSDSMLYLDNGFGITERERYRGQHIEVTIAVPVGKRIKVDRSVTRRLGNFRIDEDWDFDNDWHDRYDSWESNVEYVMTIGGLERVDKKNEEVNNDEENGRYRYDTKTEITIDSAINIQIDKNKIRQETIIKLKEKEIQEQIRALEEMKKSRTQRNNSNNSKSDEPASIAQTESRGEVSGNLFSPWFTLVSRMR